MVSQFLDKFRGKRLRILWLVMGALLLVAVTPLWLYHRQALHLSEEKLQDTERVQQSEITRLLANETWQFEQGLLRQLKSQRQVLAITGWIQNVDDPTHAPQLSRLLEDFVENNPDILFVTAVSREAKGPTAGSVSADRDPFVDAALKRAFQISYQGADSVSSSFAEGQNARPALVMSVPLFADGQYSGMLAAVVSLESLQNRLRDMSVRDRTVYIVDGQGKIVAYPDGRAMVPGQNVTSISPPTKQFGELPKDLRATQTTNFVIQSQDRRHKVEMIGTYSTIPELRWAVIAQRSLDNARVDAGVTELTSEALQFVVGVTFIALLLGYLFAVRITNPIRGLVESTRAISRAEFHERVPVSGIAEIGELAETFNHMAGDIEEFVKKLQAAAEENRELFMGSIRMLAAAIDEKDPYTRGHSGRVAKYSITLGEYLGFSAEELDKLRISALLHDVGKIGVDDRVLKKPGKLTEEEFDLMKQHTVKGANIMRPVAQLKDMLPGIELHHERMNGQGYPYGLQGDQIPMMARVIAVADTLDAITTNRPYQSAMDLDYALERIRSLGVTHFDPQIVTALESAVHDGRLRLSAALVEV